MWLTIVLLLLFCWLVYRRQRRIERRRAKQWQQEDDWLKLSQPDREALARIEKRLDELLRQQEEDWVKLSAAAAMDKKTDAPN